MIAIVAGDERTRCGPLPVALSYAGFEPLGTADASEVASELGARDASGCVLVLDLHALHGERDRWRELLDEHCGLAAVLVTRGEVDSELTALATGPHRLVLHRPFDASAVVAAALRASASAPARIQRVPGTASSPGSKYAS